MIKRLALFSRIMLALGALLLIPLAPSIASAKSIADDPRLERLFEELKTAESPLEADRLSGQIDEIWRSAKGETAELLLSRADDAIGNKDYSLAIDVLDQLIAMEPEFAEAWNRRATVFYLSDDYGRSLADIAVTLALEPRHYGALTGLGLILEELGEDKKAYEALHRSITLNPYQDNVKKELETLETSAIGQTV
ncbi:MAG: tetratricopeptide repeat protein [Rhizobiales bacterium]|nr:tetratricopeptide repeat protein [Hyphomicrobiales bacterium]